MDGKIFQGVCLHAGRGFGVAKGLHNWEQRDVGFAFLKSIKGRVGVVGERFVEITFPMF